MKIRENICTTQSRQKANFHNTLRTLQKQNAIQNNNKKKPQNNGMNRGPKQEAH